LRSAINVSSNFLYLCSIENWSDKD